jgi:hypothetical protein
LARDSNTTWNFTITKGDGTTVTKTADCSSIYTDARVGYYTQAQYDSHYKDGVTAGWQSVWFHWSDSPKNTNYVVTDAIGKYMTAHYTDADGVYHEWDTSWGPIPNPGTPPNSMKITRATWHSTSGTRYYGKLYYWDDDVEDYVAVIDQDRYWYHSGSNKSGTTTVYYN